MSIDVRRALVLAAVFALACGSRTDLGGASPERGGAADAAPVSTPFVQVACGEHHTCARRQDGAVFCWGLDTSAQTSAPASPTSPPTRAPLGAASSIGLGAYHSCAVVGGRVLCWGDDRMGQLGSTFAQSAQPVDVGVAHAAAVTAGSGTTCALFDDATVDCWGKGYGGQVGWSPSATPSSGNPLAKNAASLSRSAGGSEHTCTVGQDGGVECWGLNAAGEIGSGADESFAPTPQIALATGALGVAVADYSSCAVMRDASLRCWGENDHGQLGDGSLLPSPVPVAANATGVRAVAVGPSHTCVLQDGGRVSCWGGNADGELGDGTTTDSASPVVALDGGATDLCAGGNHTCATTSEGRVLCWGLGTSGELGAVTDRRTTPTPVDGL